MSLKVSDCLLLKKIFSFSVIPFVVFVTCFWKVGEIVEFKWKSLLSVKFQIWVQHFYTKNEIFQQFFKGFDRIKGCVSWYFQNFGKGFFKENFPTVGAANSNSIITEIDSETTLTTDKLFWRN